MTIFTSKFYISEKSWTGRPAWWFEIPQNVVGASISTKIHLLCQTAPNAKVFYCLKVPSRFFKTHLPELYVRRGNAGQRKVSLFLSAEKKNIFVDQRGDGKVCFAQFQYWPRGRKRI